MKCQKWLQQILGMVFVIVTLVSCATTATPVSQAPIATPTLVDATTIPTPNPPTAASVPPTATMIPTITNTPSPAPTLINTPAVVSPTATQEITFIDPDEYFNSRPFTLKTVNFTPFPSDLAEADILSEDLEPTDPKYYYSLKGFHEHSGTYERAKDIYNDERWNTSGLDVDFRIKAGLTALIETVMEDAIELFLNEINNPTLFSANYPIAFVGFDTPPEGFPNTNQLAQVIFFHNDAIDYDKGGETRIYINPNFLNSHWAIFGPDIAHEIGHSDFSENLDDADTSNDIPRIGQQEEIELNFYSMLADYQIYLAHPELKAESSLGNDYHRDRIKDWFNSGRFEHPLPGVLSWDGMDDPANSFGNQYSGINLPRVETPANAASKAYARAIGYNGLENHGQGGIDPGGIIYHLDTLSKALYTKQELAEQGQILGIVPESLGSSK